MATYTENGSFKGAQTFDKWYNTNIGQPVLSVLGTQNESFISIWTPFWPANIKGSSQATQRDMERVNHTLVPRQEHDKTAGTRFILYFPKLLS